MHETVLVTGAAGFIGGRLVEALHASGETRVRAGIRRWASAARIGRLPVEIVTCDVTDRDSVRRGMAGMSRVIHCAWGPAEVNVEGTRNVVDAAAAEGVDRVVHLSTVDVYGRPSGEVDESTPLDEGFGEYGDSKIRAEKICRASMNRVPITILRPTVVYGPFSPEWTLRFVRLMASGRWTLPEDYGGGEANPVYVDDLVRAALLALRRDGAVGEAFNVNGPDRLTWREYIRSIEKATGLPGPRLRSTSVVRLRGAVMAPVREGARLALRHLSPLAKALYRRSRVVRGVMERTETAIRTTPSGGEIDFYDRPAHYPVEKARRLLGFEPTVTLSRGQELTALWLAHHGYLPRGGHRV
ncbi:MAG: NAD-dependent epimerase/dehydratase family protein [Longimicrobiales bacterium]|nr:NAD-dependent epimerase/dehydratase family protein [Longimicrobiales bacterium]